MYVDKVVEICFGCFGKGFVNVIVCIVQQIVEVVVVKDIFQCSVQVLGKLCKFGDLCCVQWQCMGGVVLCVDLGYDFGSCIGIVVIGQYDVMVCFGQMQGSVVFKVVVVFGDDGDFYGFFLFLMIFKIGGYVYGCLLYFLQDLFDFLNCWKIVRCDGLCVLLYLLWIILFLI